MSKNLWVVGDSTLSSFEDKYYLPRYGYGTKLQEYLDDEIIVKNIALSGRSSKSYTTEPEYQTLLSGMKKDDYLIIGFGHNDEKTENDRYLFEHDSSVCGICPAVHHLSDEWIFQKHSLGSV